MNVLVFNCGSSSLTYKIFQTDDPENPWVVSSGKAHRVGVKRSQPSYVEHRANGNVQKDVFPKDIVDIADSRRYLARPNAIRGSNWAKRSEAGSQRPEKIQHGRRI